MLLARPEALMGHLPDVYNLQRRNPTPDILRAQPGVVEPNHFANNTKMAARDASGIDGSSPSSSATSTTYPKPRQIMWDELVSGRSHCLRACALCLDARAPRRVAFI